MGALPRIQDFDDADYDLVVSDDASFGVHEDPYPQLARWRAQGPVHAFDYRTAMGLHPDVTMADMPRLAGPTQARSCSGSASTSSRCRRKRAASAPLITRWS
jgi:hypothetical protein